MWYMYAVEYYSTIKKNEIMASAITGTDLGGVILSEVRQKSGNIVRHPLYVESRKKWYKLTHIQNTNRLTGWEKEFLVAGGRMGRRDSQGVWDGHGHAAVFNTENQQGPAGQHRGLCSVSYGSLDGRGAGGEWIRVYVGLSPFASHLKLTQYS